MIRFLSDFQPAVEIVRERFNVKRDRPSFLSLSLSLLLFFFFFLPRSLRERKKEKENAARGVCAAI